MINRILVLAITAVMLFGLSFEQIHAQSVTISARMNPNNNNGQVLYVGSTFTRDVIIDNPDGGTVKIYELLVTYEPDKLQVDSFDLSTNAISDEGQTYIDNTNGAVKLSKVGISGISNTTINAGRITFRVVGTGRSIVRISEATVAVEPAGQSGLIIPTVSTQSGVYDLGGPTPTYTPAPTTPPQPTNTPAPTNTPVPTSPPQPTNQPGPTNPPALTTEPTAPADPTVEPTPTPTCEQMKRMGNYNCSTDYVVDNLDFTAWFDDFLGNIVNLEYFEYWRRVFYNQ